MRKLILLAFVLLFLTEGNCQVRKNSNSRNLLIGHKVDLHIDGVLDFVKTKYNFDDSITFRLIEEKTGAGDNVHYKHQAYYKGLPIEGAIFTSHADKQKFKSLYGHPNLKVDLELIPRLDSNAAFEYAMRHLKDGKDGNVNHSINLKILSPLLDVINPNFKLVYEFIFLSDNPEDRLKLYVDANTGILIKKIPLIEHHGVPSEVETFYFGKQWITVDSLAPDYYVLRDPTRGNINGFSGNTTFINDIQFGTIRRDKNYWSFEDEDQVALDAHWGAKTLYDFLKDNFDWEGIDGNGSSMDCVVNINEGNNYVNAYWDGERANFGTGNCHYSPLTSLDIIGHEFMHGINRKTADLGSNAESKAILEGVCDALGKTLEYYHDADHFTWEVGNRFATNSNVAPFRSMEEPNVFQHPKYYKGAFWYETNAPHHRAGVFNYWFYLLVKGGTGETENNELYTVEPIGMFKAMRIVFHTVIHYMDAYTSYSDVFELTGLATKELHGLDSKEFRSVRAAWIAVGLPAQANVVENDLAIQFESEEIRSCISNAYYPLELILQNKGTDTIPINQVINASLFNGETTYDLDISLEAPLIPNQQRKIIITDYLFLSDFISLELVARLNQDDNNYNNFDKIKVVNTAYDRSDLAITKIENLNNNCFYSYSDLALTFTNVGCKSIPQGTEIYIQIWVEDEMLEERKYVLSHTLWPGDIIGQKMTTDIVDEYVEIKLVEDAETNLMNNSVKLFLNSNTSIESPYHNPLEGNQHLSMFSGEGNFMEYNGETMFSVAQNSGDQEFLLCPDFNEIFEGKSLPSFNWCVDFTTIDNPMLSFDLVQFKHDYNHDDLGLNQYATMVFVEWNSEEGDNNVIISDQPKGELINHIIDLPKRFKGEVKISFYSYKGGVIETVSDLEKFDVNLINNISFYDGLDVGLLENNARDFILTPNPVNNNLFVIQEHGNLGMQYSIYNLNGEVLRKNQYLEKSIDTSALLPGVYFLVIKSTEEKLNIKRFIKI